VWDQGWAEHDVGREGDPTGGAWNRRPCMRRILAITGVCFIVSAAAAQSPSQSAASKADSLSLEQKTEISKLITKQTPPLEASFPIAIDAVVPSGIDVHPLPADVEKLAPQLHGFGYVEVEELVAIVEPHTRKIEIVFPRWGGG